MERTIKIGNKAVRLNNNIGWTMEYKSQFGKDIIPTLMPMLAALADVVSSVLRDTGKAEDISLKDILQAIDGDTITDAAIHLGGFEFEDFIDITWAMAKTADDNVPDPKTWIKGFDSFYVDEIAPQVFELITKGVVSSKNLKRLKMLKVTNLQPQSTSTQSSSQELSEG